ncbi:DUF5627 domain-containing protein [Compostibacter hankyongensis]|uniref:DUF1735 domain-containing protein n=1 Tax=Compostibacter hankyongensis TaxID=1007089 RepID=A0ABP8FD19_9BACT
MKKKYIVLASLSVMLCSCHNFEIAHPDFEYTSGYFPYQFPVRTLVLGDYIYDNTNDNNHQFLISAHIGGVYENDKKRTFSIAVDNSLTDHILFSSGGDTIRPMPAKYYSLSADNIVIPEGKMYSGVTVQLTDAFFEDPDAIRLSYVIPVRLKGSEDVDTLLAGKTESPDADPRVASQWTEPPKNFTMFAVKYINEYHGNYFHYGKSTLKDSTGAVTEDTTYSEKYVENNPVSKLTTTGRYEVAFSTFLHTSVLPEEVSMLLTFDGNKCTVTAAAGAPYTVSGMGEFKSKAYAWGNKKRDGIQLTYTVSDGKNTCTATDVLVVRDREVVMETYTPVVY